MNKLSHIFSVFIITALTANAALIIVNKKSTTTNQTGTAKNPYQTIQAALDIANPGDTVQVSPGIYRESIHLPSGTPNKPITLTGKNNNQVIISGMQKLTGWKKYSDDIYVTETNYRPTRLYVGFRREQLSREPNEGWWQAEQAKDEIITDHKNLKDFKKDIPGAETYIWTKHGNTYFTTPIIKYDTRSCTLTIKRTSKWMKLNDGDKYYLQNQVSLIDQPGEWATAQNGAKWLIYYRPTDKKDLEKTEIPVKRDIISISKANNVIVRNLKITGAVNHGIAVNESKDVIINYCVAYNNNNHGINMRNSRNITISNCISAHNYCGITVSSSRDITVEECEIAYNGMDGLLFTWKSDHLIARRNYIHDHLLWGHPDNSQLYRDVTNVQFIDNLLSTSGQTVMMEQTSKGEFRGNMFIGSGAAMLIFGHKSAGNYKIYNNTFAFSGYSCMSLTDKNYDVKENIFMTGTRKAIYGVRGITGYTGSRNLFWNTEGATNKTVLISDKGWHSSLKEFQNATGQDIDSVYANPDFINAPASYAIMDSKKIHLNTLDTFYIRPGMSNFTIGDHIEFNFDGMVHTVKSTTSNTITVKPPLNKKPIKPWLIANWKENSNFKLDLRLRKDSPGINLSKNGGPIGSSIDIQAYRHGDFNGDGKRDIPQNNF